MRYSSCPESWGMVELRQIRRASIFMVLVVVGMLLAGAVSDGANASAVNCNIETGTCTPVGQSDHWRTFAACTRRPVAPEDPRGTRRCAGTDHYLWALLRVPRSMGDQGCVSSPTAYASDGCQAKTAVCIRYPHATGPHCIRGDATTGAVSAQRFPLRRSGSYRLTWFLRLGPTTSRLSGSGTPVNSAALRRGWLSIGHYVVHRPKPRDTTMQNSGTPLPVGGRK